MIAKIVNHRIAGTRITVWDVLHHMENGWSVAETAEVLHLSEMQVQAAVDYDRDNQAEVMKIHEQIENRNALGNLPSIREKRADARAKRLAWRVQRHATSTLQ